MTAAVVCVESGILDALSTVTDPETGEPITALGFVRSVLVDVEGVTVHLRLPTVRCSPNFAYLIASDALDALRSVDGIGEVRLLLDGHHDSDEINAGLAADVEEGAADLRDAFLRKAHTAAMERAVTALLRQAPMDVERVGQLLLRDLPEGKAKVALLRRRFAIGLSNCPNSRVLVDESGRSVVNP